MSDETITACPHCDKNKIRYRVTSGDWYCLYCKRRFDEPIRRPPKNKGACGRKKAKHGDLDKSDLELFNND